MKTSFDAGEADGSALADALEDMNGLGRRQLQRELTGAPIGSNPRLAYPLRTMPVPCRFWVPTKHKRCRRTLCWVRYCEEVDGCQKQQQVAAHFRIPDEADPLRSGKTPVTISSSSVLQVRMHIPQQLSHEISLQPCNNLSSHNLPCFRYKVDNIQLPEPVSCRWLSLVLGSRHLTVCLDFEYKV